MCIPKSINILNELIEVNNDIIEGYQNAVLETEENEIKDLFFQFIETSKIHKQELCSEIKKLGGKPFDETIATGKFLRVWIDIKSVLSRKNRRDILKLCEYGCEVASDMYKEALRKNMLVIEAEQKDLIFAQYNTINSDLEYLVNLQKPLLNY
jgi:uncharacterized protein (TIGR02284 family)